MVTKEVELLEEAALGRILIKGKLLFSSVELVKLILDPNFVVGVKCTIFWLKRGLRVYLDLYAPYFPKSTSKYLFGLSTFLVQNILFWRRFWLKS